MDAVSIEQYRNRRCEDRRHTILREQFDNVEVAATDRPNQRSILLFLVGPRRDKRGFDLISDALPFGRLRRCWSE